MTFFLLCPYLWHIFFYFHIYDTFCFYISTYLCPKVSPILLSIPVSVLVIITALGLAAGGGYGSKNYFIRVDEKLNLISTV